MKQEGFGGERRLDEDYRYGMPGYIAFSVIAITVIMLFSLIAGGYALPQTALGQVEFKQYPGRPMPLHLDKAGEMKGDTVIRAVRYVTLGSLVGIALLMVRANRAKRNRLNEPDD